MPEHILNSKNYERKIKIFLFGVGKKAENILNQIELNTQDIKLLGFIDNDFKLWGGVKKFGKIGIVKGEEVLLKKQMKQRNKI